MDIIDQLTEEWLRKPQPATMVKGPECPLGCGPMLANTDESAWTENIRMIVVPLICKNCGWTWSIHIMLG